jgi:glutamate-1-semialdehyde 2,1-aminomutase
MPGGNSRNTVFFPPYPVYAVSGEGVTITDADGRTYLDFINNASAGVHGHSHPEIVEAIRIQAGRLTGVGLPTELEVQLAEMLVERLPSIEQVRFCNSGSEAVMFALKAARAYTGRPKIAKVEGAYHGAYDPAEASMAPRPEDWGPATRPTAVAHSVGAPAGMLADVVVLPFNDVEASLALLEEASADLAAVLIDPVVSRMSFCQADPAYLAMLRAFCDRSGAVLVFDEVFSFRCGYHGAQGAFGVLPDLTCLGKVIGGGLPVGAFGGRAEVMSVFDHRAGRPKAPHGGTFNANPLTMAAGIKSLQLLTPQAYAELARLGERVRDGMNAFFATSGIEGRAHGYGSMTSVVLSSKRFRNYREFVAATRSAASMGPVHRRLVDAGVLILASGGVMISTPMTDAHIDRLLEAFAEALQPRQSQTAG